MATIARFTKPVLEGKRFKFSVLLTGGRSIDVSVTASEMTTLATRALFAFNKSIGSK